MPYPVAAVRPKGGKPLRPRLGTPSIALQGTTVSNNLGYDGETWAQAGHPVIDSYGSRIKISQRHGQGLYLMYKNRGGAWTDVSGVSDGRLYPIPVTRSALAWDSNADKLYVLLQGSDGDTGMIVRRYQITRNGSNQITAFTGDADLNLQIDLNNGGSMYYTHPVILYCADIGANGAIVCFWGARNAGGTKGNEVRSSMRVLSNTAADAVAGNWTHLGTNSTTGIGNAPAVAYTAWMTSTADTNTYGYPSVLRKANGDLVMCFSAQVNAGTGWRYRRATYSAGQWTLQSPVDISEIVVSGSNGGYNLKHEPNSKVVIDAQDRLYYAAPVWKNNTDGDTWRVWRIDTNDTVSVFSDVYSATSGWHYDCFVVGDILMVQGLLVVSYTNLPEKDAYLAVFDPTTGLEVQSRILLDEATPWDIPLLYINEDGNVGVLARNFNAGAVVAKGVQPTYTPVFAGYDGLVPVVYQ